MAKFIGAKHVLSDHGELLGEYAESAHTSPLVPETVHVPIVVFHPNGRSPIANGSISHVDVVPTIYDALDEPIPEGIVGRSIYSTERRDTSFCGLRLPKNTSYLGRDESLFHAYNQSYASIWDSHGGWVRNQSDPRSRAIELFRAVWLVNRTRLNVINSNSIGLFKLIAYHLRQTQKSGQAELSESEAMKLIDKTLSGKKLSSMRNSINEAQKDQLENRGYL